MAVQPPVLSSDTSAAETDPSLGGIALHTEDALWLEGLWAFTSQLGTWIWGDVS